MNKAFLQDAFADVFSRPFTLAAKNGLRLPTRSVLELWQIAHWVVHDETSFNTSDRPRAEQVARTILRIAIAESSLSSRLSRRLQEDVIRNDVNGGTLLSFRKLKLEVECVAPNDTEIRIKHDEQPAEKFIQSCIRVKRGNESFLRFKLKEEPRVKDEKDAVEELPELVAAWLSVLYDVLAFAERLAVLGGASIPAPKMATRHTVAKIVEGESYRTAIEEELQWPAPAWRTFRAQGLFWRRWNNFQCKVEEERKREEERKEIARKKDNAVDNDKLDFLELISRYLVIGWIRCVLDTYIDMHWQPAGCNQGEYCDELEKLRKELLQKFPPLNCPQNEDGVIALGASVFAQAAVVHACLTDRMNQPLAWRRRFDSQEMLDWLEKDLPMFFSHWYLPIDNIVSSDPDSERGNPRFTKYTGILENREKLENFLKTGGLGLDETKADELAECAKNLVTIWKAKIPFIVAALDDRVTALFKPKEGATEHDRELRQKEHKCFLQEINELCSLHIYARQCENSAAPAEGQPPKPAATGGCAEAGPQS